LALHEGHRERLKARFRQQGLEGFTDIQVLELLLFYVIPRRDTNPIAHGLLERFGTLHQVLEAPLQELQSVEGIGENAATLLHLARAVADRYAVSQAKIEAILNSTHKCGEYLKRFYVGKRDEVVYLLCLDAKCKVLSCTEVGRGSVNSAGISIRKIVETALSFNAVSVVLSHNHPSGFAYPSPEDVATTRRVALAMDAVGIVLADHIIVAEDDFVSLTESNLYRPEECRMPF